MSTVVLHCQIPPAQPAHVPSVLVLAPRRITRHASQGRRRHEGNHSNLWTWSHDRGHMWEVISPRLSYGFCQVVEAETLSSRMGLPTPASLSLRPPALSPSSRPHARSVAASLGAGQTPTPEAVVGERVGRWDHRPRGSAGPAQGMGTLAGAVHADAWAAARSRSGW